MREREHKREREREREDVVDTRGDSLQRESGRRKKEERNEK